MTLQVQYEADPNSEALTKEERHSQHLKWYGMQINLLGEEAPPPPDPNEPDYLTEHGIFTFALAELQTLMELAERNNAFLQVGEDWVEPTRPLWDKQWPFSPAEYFARVRSQLSTIQSSAEFNWQIFEPVYILDNPGENGVSRLAAWLLEQARGNCWCKVCHQEYRSVELEVYDWERGESDGSLYVCPQGHTLLRTTLPYLGALEMFPKTNRTKRKCRPDLKAQEKD